MREHDSNMRPPALPGTGSPPRARGASGQPEERNTVAVAARLEGVHAIRDRCVYPCRFERIDLMAVVAFRPVER